MDSWLEKINWNNEGLVPVIVQEKETKQILMQAWMNQDALKKTFESGKATFWSRSRKAIWIKGELSGHYQFVESILTDCDYDALLINVRQTGGIACHTGRHHCFFNKLTDKNWVESGEILKDPKDIYEK